MNLPNITPAQVVAVVGAVIVVLVAFGVSITDDQRLAVMGLVTVVAGVLIHSDAKIRNGRAQIAAAAIQSQHNTRTELEQVVAAGKAKKPR